MNFAGSPLARRNVRRAFTLIELLVTIAIIAMLAGMLMVALDGAATSAKDAKTQAMIAKLNTIIMQKYESYKTRRVPISTAGMAPAVVALQRLRGLRELMMMEMPDRWRDVPLLDKGAAPSGGNYAPVYVERPSRTKGYARRIGSSYPTGTAAAFQGAKCLFMIVMSDPANAASFAEGDFADLDGSGFRVFVDGWGHPISWLRWPTGLNSQLQPAPHDPATAHDPFDPYNVDATAFATYPLVYSMGPDGVDSVQTLPNYQYGINGSNYDGSIIPAAAVGSGGEKMGERIAGTNAIPIHNHMMQTK